MEFIVKVFKTLFIEEIFVFIPSVFLFYFFLFSFFLKKNKGIIVNILLFLLPLFYIFYQYSYLTNFFSSLGQDSLIEINADFSEAIFYLKTLFIFLFDPEIFKRNRFWLVLLSSMFGAGTMIMLTFYLGKIKNLNILSVSKYLNLIFFISIFYVIVQVFLIVKNSYEEGVQLKNFEKKFRNKIVNYSPQRNQNHNLKIITYIGESTSALNLSLYGYPFKTTPWLDKQINKKNFIKFDQIFSTNTQSLGSLSAALSLCTFDDSEKCNGIYNLLNNLSVVDIISKAGVETNLYSLQSLLGGHNLASKLVLNTKNKYFPFQSEKKTKKLQGDRYTPETHDKDFFKNSFCENEKKFKNKSSSLTILHSYAGHGIYGGYLGLLPDSELFSYPEYINKKNFLGRDHRNFKNINEYDTAINYIDETLEEVFNCSINKLPKSEPIVFIYFSDHGESPASMRGHDASRLTYEMLHVPFFIYFNDEAKKIFKEKFDFLKKLSTTKLTLKSLSDILIYLYDIDVKENKTNKVLYSHDSFNSLKTDYIVVRKDLDGKIEKIQTFFHYKGKSINNEISEKQFAYNDTSINLWQINNFLETNNIKNTKKINNLICRHRANSFIMQYVASLSIGCFETDVYFFDDKVISAHGIENDTGLEINDFLKSSYKKNTLWLDSKNLYSKEKCILARNWLEKKSQKFESLLVEIPTQSISNYNDIEWIQCINNINMIDNVQVGYYMPVNYLNDCNNNKIEAYLCNKELQKIISFLKKTNISSITFDYQVYDLIKDFNSFSSYKWHIWHVNKLDDLAKLLKLNNLGIILLTNNKFTNNLN